MKNNMSTQKFQKPLPYDIFTDKTVYQIVFNLPANSSSPLDCFLNQLDRKLIILSDQGNSDLESRVPCIFCAPPDANLNAVRIQTLKDIHIISIPRIQKASQQKILNEWFTSQKQAIA